MNATIQPTKVHPRRKFKVMIAAALRLFAAIIAGKKYSKIPAIKKKPAMREFYTQISGR
jgi:hypothetical protein